MLNITSVMLEFTFNWQTFETYIIKIRWRHAHNALCWSAVISWLKGFHPIQVHKEILAGRMKSDKLNWREIIYLVIYFVSYIIVLLCSVLSLFSTMTVTKWHRHYLVIYWSVTKDRSKLTKPKKKIHGYAECRHKC